MSEFYDRVYNAVKLIPKGRVATYGQIAAIAGNSRAARAVGWALHVNPKPGYIPCHRVINRFGKICEGFAFGGPEVEKRLLEEEGVEVSDDYFVDLSKYGI